jgi:hypothetical protein
VFDHSESFTGSEKFEGGLKVGAEIIVILKRGN